MLQRLNAAGLKTTILSNGSPDMLDAAVSKAGIGDLLDAVLSVELAGRRLQAAPQGLSARRRPVGGTSRGDLLPVFECVGRLRRLGLRHARRVVQPLRPTTGAPAGKARSLDRLAGGAARAGRRVEDLPCPSLLGGFGSLFGRFDSLFGQLGNWPVGRAEINGLAASGERPGLPKPAIWQYILVEQGVDATRRAALSGADSRRVEEEPQTCRRSHSAGCWSRF